MGEGTCSVGVHGGGHALFCSQSIRPLLQRLCKPPSLLWLSLTSPMCQGHLKSSKTCSYPQDAEGPLGLVNITIGFYNGSVVKNPPANAGDVSSIPGSGRSPGEGNGNPLQYSCLGNPMNRGAGWATVHGVAKQPDTDECRQDHNIFIIITIHLLSISYGKALY